MVTPPARASDSSFHAITRFSFIAANGPDGTGIPEPAMEGTRDQRPTAGWVWYAESGIKVYHDNMDGAGFEWWVENRLIPGFEAQFPGKKMILVMDSASYHHQMNTEYYPEKKTPDNATKGLNVHVLRTAGCVGIGFPHVNKTTGALYIQNFEVGDEPASVAAYRTGGPKAPVADLKSILLPCRPVLGRARGCDDRLAQGQQARGPGLQGG